MKTLKSQENCICCLKLVSKSELISGSFREIKIWKTDDWVVVNRFIMHTSYIRSIEIIPLTGEIITSAEKDDIKIWDKNKGFEILKF